MIPHPYPATPPSFPHSISSPSVSFPEVHSPAASTKTYHPYLIQTTSSSLLTRTNSYPTQPLMKIASHRPSRSMSSLSHVAGFETAEDEPKSSMESPSARPGMRRSGTLPVFPAVDEKVEKGVDVPTNPKLWTPSELARYLGHTLRTGGTDGNGQILPAPLVEDIKTWMLRQQVTGRAFLRGDAEGWASAFRPPPFLPLLLSISRRLRRSSLQGRISRTFDSSRSLSGCGIQDDSSMGTASVLLEEDEDHHENEAEISGVRRMAKSFDERGSASEASGDDEPSPEKLKEQWTGESTRSEAWKRWELKRNDSGGTRPSGYCRKRRASIFNQGGLTDAESSPMLGDRDLRDSSPESGIVTPMEGIVEEIMTAKASRIDGIPMVLSATGSSDATSLPPYASLPAPAPFSQAHSPSRLISDATPLHPRRSNRSSVTPTPDRPRGHSDRSFSPDTPIDTPSNESSGSVHMSGILQHRATGADPYAPLRWTASSDSTSGGARLPKLVSTRSEEDSIPLTAAEAELEGSRWTSSRRVTLRADPISGLFRGPNPPSVKSEREMEMETEVASLLNRIENLETRLSRASRPTSPVSPVLAILPTALLDRLGLRVGDPDDPLPRTITELPAYLFFIGVGVGAVMVRVLLGRGR